MNNVILRMENIRKSYAGKDSSQTPLVILDDITMELYAGELVGLVAPSGAGKSTLLHIAGLLDQADKSDKSVKSESSESAQNQDNSRLSDSEITLAGQKINNLNDNQRTKLRRHHIGFVYQFHHLLPEFSALENLLIPQLFAGVAKPAARIKAQEMLALMGLAERTHHRPSQLSGGEQQRVAVARALINSPSLILADEPSGNLDRESGLKLMDLLIKLIRGKPHAALIATHNLDHAKMMDRCVTLVGGKIIPLKI